ncbi:MAG: lactate utilization protein [Desulfobacterales bacterium]
MDQKKFINRIRMALGNPAAASQRIADVFKNEQSDEIRAILERLKNRSPGEREKLLTAFRQAAEPINLQVTSCEGINTVTAAIVDLVRDKDPEWGHKKSVVAWQHPLIENLNLPAALSELDVDVFFTDSQEPEEENLRRHVTDSYIGITTADFCMADTATLVMRTRAGQARSVSLLPAIHIAVVELNQIIADLKELYVLLKWDPQMKVEGLTNCMTFISGPSKTADIEATMVHGAHGPREVHVFVITT